MVKLPAEPVIRPARDITTSVAQVSTQSRPPAPALQPTSAPAEVSKPAKRSLLQSLNPLNLFRKDEKQPTLGSGQTPSASSDGASGMPGVSSTLSDLASAQPGVPRYTYRSPAAPKPGNRREAERVFAEALQAQQKRRYNEAQAGYRRATQLDPANFKARYNLGLVTAEFGDLPAALEEYEYALALQSDSPDARYNFALLLKQAGYWIDAAGELEKLLATNARDARSHLALANLYAQQFQQPAKARVHYLKVLELEPRHPQAAAIRYWLAANP